MSLEVQPSKWAETFERPRSGEPLVSVVLLSYNRPRRLAHALASVEGQSYQSLEVILVDNPSPATDQIVQLAQQHSGVNLICNHRNVGFAGGMNVGISQAEGKYVFLTEDDIIVHPQCIDTLVHYMDLHPGVALASGVMYNKADNTIRSAGGHVRLGRIYQNPIRGAGEEDTGQFPEPFEVNYIPGAFIMARREVLSRLGGFREHFFMYYEDTELCLRVQKAGHRIAVVPAAKVYHWDPPQEPADHHLESHKFKNFLSLYTLHARLYILPEVFLRYLVFGLVKTLRRDRPCAASLWQGFRWYLRLLPALLRERYAR